MLLHFIGQKSHCILNGLIFTFISGFISILSIAQEYGRGLEITDFDTSKLIFKKIPTSRGALPSSYSLISYAPSVESQGNMGSCTSWAAAYCAFTIVKRVESETTIGPFDPLNLHSRLKAMDSEDPCSDGNHVSRAAALLASNGCPEFQNQSCRYVSANYSYSHKLFDYEDLSINSYHFKYVISQERSPIVISAYYYTNGWGNNLNLPYGVWNGLCGGVKDGAHAMVIIGYDDYVGGGAFLVQNSWGSAWGAQGYFWLKYSDLNKVVYAATQFKPAAFSDDFDEIDFGSDQVYRFYNDCSLTTYISLSQNIANDWVTKGWYAISSGDYIDLSIGERSANQVYWMATALLNGQYIDWVDNSNGTSMCFDRVNAHTIYNNDPDQCADISNFYKTVPDSRTNMVTMKLTCPNINTRGGEVIISPEWNSLEIASGDSLVEAWDGKSGLIDPYSTRPIYPDQFGNYDIYYIEKDKVKHYTGAAEGLIKIKELKFANEHNAKGYLEALKTKK
jgi:hypothetical protein